MTDAQIPVSQQIDAALDEIQQARAEMIAQPASVGRSLYLAELADVEAWWWGLMFEQSRTRVQWRAVLVAREYALHTARRWRRRAALQQVSEPSALLLPATEAA